MSLYRQSAAILCRFSRQLTITDKRGIKRWVGPTVRELVNRRKNIDPEAPKPRSSYLEWNYEAEIYAFGNRLGETFDRGVLLRALTQREYANLEEFKARDAGEPNPKLEHNHEMILEGHDIICKVIRDEYKSYPVEIVEAVLKFLTTDEMLGLVGKHIGLTDILKTTEFPVETLTLANTFKAVVSAVKKSQNLEKAEVFVRDFVLCQMNGKDVYDVWTPEKPFDYLENLLKNKGVEGIEPRLCNESASNTILANYQVGLYKNKKLLGIGWGESIEIARDTAAINAIQRIYGNYVQK